MKDKFFDLKKEKQDRIINGALKVFALNGYKRASTDEMVKEAGISKGLLFHYFESKKGVYIFICQYSAKYLAMELSRAVGMQETDFFELQKQMELAKLRVMKNYPYMQHFLNQAFLETDEEAVTATEAEMDYASKVLQQIYAKADLSKFKETVDPSMVLKMTLFALNGLMNDYIKKEPLMLEALYEESAAYLNMLKDNLYKEE
ncbi:MAG: TetR/AcrR family transcriptional regulator [Lachnospiraceae bacterium]|nr:TetR/AcrR family transcriptional regulator [Lachnospiraceae bacterium]